MFGDCCNDVTDVRDSENNVGGCLDPFNGLYLSGCCLPREIIMKILSFLDADSLLKHRLTCKVWKDIIDTHVWKHKAIHECQNSFSNLKLPEKYGLIFPNHVFYSLCKYDSFNTNLIKNNCGQEGFLYWQWQSQRESPDNHGWKREECPSGADPLPETPDFNGCTSCYVTTYYRCTKEQRIILKDYGFSSKIMDTFQPCILASEWYAGRFDCGCKYKLNVELLGDNDRVIDEKEVTEIVRQWEGREWHKVEITFESYGPGVRSIIFRHSGQDTQFWAGHYGSKMAGAVLKISLPTKG